MMAASSPRRATRSLRRAEGGIPLGDLNVGDEFEGTVTRISNIGLWIEIGAKKEALLPQSQMPKPKSDYAKGDKISGLKIFEVTAGDTPSTRKIRVTTKRLATEIQVGDTYTGKVVRTTEFGVFFDIGAISDVLGPRSLLRDGEFNVGEEVPLKVVKVEGEKISVSTDMDATTPAKGRPEGVAGLTVGEEVSGTISKTSEQFGLFINIGLSRDALFRRNQLEKPLNEYKVGDRLDGLKIVSVNIEKAQVEVSQRRLPQDVKLGEELEGTVTQVVEFGVFFDAGLAGDVLAPSRQLAKEPTDYVRNVVAKLIVTKVEGDRITVTDKSAKELGIPLRDLVRGTIVKGEVSSLGASGAFIDIGAERDALLRKPPPEVKAGDQLKELIISRVDIQADQLEVSMLDSLAQEDPATPLADISIGAEVDGTVSRVSEFGLFIDVGATRDALFPSAQLPQPLNSYKAGDRITGLKVSDVDAVKSRLAVSLRPTAADFKVGDVVDGTVTKIQAFGVFVDVGASTDALLPKRLLEKEPSDYQQGDVLSGLKVVTSDPANNRLSVGQTDSRAGDDQAGRITFDDLKVGNEITGIVRNLQDYGVFVDIGLFRRDALLPVSQFGAKKMEDFKVGQSVELYILNVEEQVSKVTLSVNSPEADPWAKYKSKADYVPKGDMMPDPKYMAFRWGEEINDEEPIDHEDWEKKFPGMFVFAEKETEVVGFMRAVNFWGREQMTSSTVHWLPMPLHLRREDAGLPEIPDFTWDDYKMGYEHIGIKPEIGVKYRFPPFNDPNWVFRNKNWDWKKIAKYNKLRAKEEGRDEEEETGDEGAEGEEGASAEPEPTEPEPVEP